MEGKMGLYHYLASLPNVEEAADYWLYTRCVLCGDSKKNPNKKRLYICCDPTDPTEGVGYICFNCNATGILTRDMLDEITGGNSGDWSQTLRQINKQVSINSGSAKTNKFKNDRVMKVTFPPLKVADYQMKKYRYLVNRIGCIIQPDMFENLKIVWSLRDFLSENGLTFNDKCKIPPMVLEENFIGFCSVKNEYILFRNINPCEKKFRWYKYNIFQFTHDLSSQYTIRNSINPVTDCDVHIVVAEGVFDAISILYNIYDGVQGDNIFTATSNGAFENAIKHYITSGMIGSNVYVDCYVDNDSIYDYSKLRSRIEFYIGGPQHVRVFHNTKQKDFGFPKSEIEIEEILL